MPFVDKDAVTVKISNSKRKQIKKQEQFLDGQTKARQELGINIKAEPNDNYQSLPDQDLQNYYYQNTDEPEQDLLSYGNQNEDEHQQYMSIDSNINQTDCIIEEISSNDQRDKEFNIFDCIADGDSDHNMIDYNIPSTKSIFDTLLDDYGNSVSKKSNDNVRKPEHVKSMETEKSMRCSDTKIETEEFLFESDECCEDTEMEENKNEEDCIREEVEYLSQVKDEEVADIFCNLFNDDAKSDLKIAEDEDEAEKEADAEDEDEVTDKADNAYESDIIPQNLSFEDLDEQSSDQLDAKHTFRPCIDNYALKSSRCDKQSGSLKTQSVSGINKSTNKCNQKLSPVEIIAIKEFLDDPIKYEDAEKDSMSLSEKDTVSLSHSVDMITLDNEICLVSDIHEEQQKKVIIDQSKIIENDLLSMNSSMPPLQNPTNSKIVISLLSEDEIQNYDGFENDANIVKQRKILQHEDYESKYTKHGTKKRKKSKKKEGYSKYNHYTKNNEKRKAASLEKKGGRLSQSKLIPLDGEDRANLSNSRNEYLKKKRNNRRKDWKVSPQKSPRSKKKTSKRTNKRKNTKRMRKRPLTEVFSGSEGEEATFNPKPAKKLRRCSARLASQKSTFWHQKYNMNELVNDFQNLHGHSLLKVDPELISEDIECDCCKTEIDTANNSWLRCILCRDPTLDFCHSCTNTGE